MDAVTAIRRVLCSALLVLLALGITPARAATAADTARLAREVERVEGVRAVKRLQNAFAQYAQAGMWREMASLFARDGRVTWGAEEAGGPDGVHQYFLAAFGQGREGLPPGGLHTRMIVRPVINLSPDGLSAKGRWIEFAMTGRYGGEANWSGGIYENSYVKEGGVWKLSHLHYYPVFAGPHETGWLNAEPDLKIVPYHFTPDEVGVPVPPLPLEAHSGPAADRRDLDRRASAMVEHDAVLNLQHAYGFYLDRKMWDDVVDLFTADGVLEEANLGVWQGPASIRRFLQRAGPAGLKRGEVNEHILFNTIVDVAPSGVEAVARGLQLTQLGEAATGQASLSVGMFKSRFVKQAGVWRIREMRTFPLMKSDYYQGWHNSRIVDRPPAAPHAPDRASPEAAALASGAALPAFGFANPVTGRASAYPPGTRAVARNWLLARLRADAPALPGRDPAETRRKLAVAVGYDATENLSSAFGAWNDDLQWDKFARLFARDGWRGKAGLGFYIGPERIYQVEVMTRGGPASPRTTSEFHFRMQPVIHVAPDGKSARLRSRYLHLGTRADTPGTFAAGSYSNDATVLEDGVWRFSNAAIDDGYIESNGYRNGWARPRALGAEAPLGGALARAMRELPPDVPIQSMPIRQQGFIPGAQIRWPDIKPMWFSYPNPVSGRLPPHYCPDEHTCEAELAARASGR